MSIKLSADKAFTYLKSRLFPWNFLLEPVDDASIEHYIKLAIPRAVGALKKGSDIETVFAFKVKEIADDFLRNPEDAKARKVHGRFAKDYPFAYAQCLAYAMLYDLKEEFTPISDVVDMERFAKLLGMSTDMLDKRERLIESLLHQHKGAPPGISAKSLLGQKVIYSDGTLVGIVRDIVFDNTTLNLLGAIVKLEKGVDISKLPMIDDKHVLIPVDAVKLTNAYNEYIILRPTKST
ncbi:MAG: PRC-barrel domain-containing protein [Methanocellales archaeon]|nr:PRC-barrel domain-containing protein [Methanocellales archaeon]